MDTSGVTVDENSLLRGRTALGANGELVTGVVDVAPLYNGLDQTESGYALEARQGKILNDKIDNHDLGFYINDDGYICQRVSTVTTT